MKATTTWAAMIAVVLLVGTTAACGDDDDDAAALTDYCELARTLDEQERFPTTEQLEGIRDAAPEEVAQEVNIVATALIDAGEDPFAAFEDPDVERAMEAIEAFDAGECGIEQEAGDDDEEEQDPSVTELDPAAARVEVTATDYAFALASKPSAGRTSFVMTNEGEERHLMALLKLAEGATWDDVMESEGEEGVEEELESDSVAGGGEAVLTADLVPGDYALICYIPDSEGTPHVMLGMSETFTVS